MWFSSLQVQLTSTHTQRGCSSSPFALARPPQRHGRVRENAVDDLIKHELVPGLGEVDAVPVHAPGRVLARLPHQHRRAVHLGPRAAPDVPVEVILPAAVPAARPQRRVPETCKFQTSLTPKFPFDLTRSWLVFAGHGGDLTELLGLADELVLGGVDVDVGEGGVGECRPEAGHGLVQPRVEELGAPVQGHGAAGAVLLLGEVRAEHHGVRQAAERRRVVHPEVPPSKPVHALHAPGKTELLIINRQFGFALFRVLGVSCCTWMPSANLSMTSGT